MVRLCLARSDAHRCGPFLLTLLFGDELEFGLLTGLRPMLGAPVELGSEHGELAFGENAPVALDIARQSLHHPADLDHLVHATKYNKCWTNVKLLYSTGRYADTGWASKT